MDVVKRATLLGSEGKIKCAAVRIVVLFGSHKCAVEALENMSEYLVNWRD